MPFYIIGVSGWVIGLSIRGWFAGGRISVNDCMLDVYNFDRAGAFNADGIGIDLVVDVVDGDRERTGLLGPVENTL